MIRHYFIRIMTLILILVIVFITNHFIGITEIAELFNTNEGIWSNRLAVAASVVGVLAASIQFIRWMFKRPHKIFFMSKGKSKRVREILKTL